MTKDLLGRRRGTDRGGRWEWGHPRTGVSCFYQTSFLRRVYTKVCTFGLRQSEDECPEVTEQDWDPCQVRNDSFPPTHVPPRRVGARGRTRRVVKVGAPTSVERESPKTNTDRTV